MKKHAPPSQRGGFVIGLIVGLLIGLALALGVALYVTKAPNPFVNRVPQRSPIQDAAEAERNRNWDPNAPLAGRNPARGATGTVSGDPTASAPAIAASEPTAIVVTPKAASSAASAAVSDRAAERAAAASAARAATAASALNAGGDPFTYFVQAGAFGRAEDAEQQRAKLAMLGVESRLTEREQAGHTVYRVRVGPFDRKDDADTAKEKLSDAGIDAALVRVQK